MGDTINSTADTFDDLKRQYADALRRGEIDKSDIAVALECGCNDPFQHNEKSDD